MMNSNVWQVFWSHSFWLPPPYTWQGNHYKYSFISLFVSRYFYSLIQDLIDTPEMTYPNCTHLLYPLAFSILLVFIRFQIER